MSTNCYERGEKTKERSSIGEKLNWFATETIDSSSFSLTRFLSFLFLFLFLEERIKGGRTKDNFFPPPFSFISIILIFFVETEHNNTWMESKYLARIGFGKEIFRRSLNYRYALGLPGIVIKTDRGKKEKERGRERNNEERRVTRGERELYVNSHYRGSH